MVKNIITVVSLVLLTGGYAEMATAGAESARVTTASAPRPSMAGAIGYQFPIAQKPTVSDWQRFHVMTSAELSQLWLFHAKAGASLGHWAWEWRLGWIRACGDRAKDATWCQEVLETALSDKALVVRAEAADQIGLLFQKNDVSDRRSELRERYIKLLTKAFRRTDNQRNGKPLFVCKRIIAALNKMSTKESLSAAKELAKTSPEMLKYWRSLVNSRIAIHDTEKRSTSR